MAFNDFTEFPRGRKVISNLNSTPQTIFAANTSFKILRITISGSSGSTTRRITFRGASGGATIVVASVPADQIMPLPGWQTDALGVEVLTDSGTTDVNITAFTVEPTIS